MKISDGFNQWSRSFDGAVDDVFNIQKEIYEGVTTSLSVTLGVEGFSATSDECL